MTQCQFDRQSEGRAMAVARNADGRLEVFVTGAEGPLLHVWQEAPNSDWSHWQSLGGRVAGAPGVGRNLDGRLEVFTINPDDGGLWHIFQTAPSNGWSEWFSLG